MIAAAEMPWKSACGRWPTEDLDRQDRVAALDRVGQEGHETAAPMRMQRRRLADGAGHGQDDAGHDPGRGGRQDRAADHLPARRAQGVGALALGVGHRPQGLDGRDDHDRQDQQGQRQAGREGRRPELEQPHEERQAEDAVDDRGHAGEVADVRLEQPVEQLSRAYSSR